MRLYEFTSWRDDVPIDYNQIRKIRDLLGIDTSLVLPPVFKIDTEIPKDTLAFCQWKMGHKQVEIHLRPEVMKYRDKTLVNRLIAHELCHEAVYFLYWVPIFAQEYSEKGDGTKESFEKLAKGWIKYIKETDGHGKEWQKYADMVNGLIGPKYVTKTSDETYDLSLVKKWWQFWKKS
jgi:hypothetical protein